MFLPIFRIAFDVIDTSGDGEMVKDEFSKVSFG